ncbi:MAG: hypothetical protein ABSG74_03330 [Candidatus Bathyarchaeia archaeon]|jgi:hypothetical protein
MHQRWEDEENHENWELELWTKIVKTACDEVSEKKVCEEYSGGYAVSRYAVTTPTLHWRLRSTNRNKTYSKQIKPFNFVLVGQPTETGEHGEPIHPITKFTRRIEEAPFQPFIDYSTGKRYPSGRQLFWKTLRLVIHDYLDHPESKFWNGRSTGKMRRRQLVVNNIAWIGKEANGLEEREIFGLDDRPYVDYLPTVNADNKPRGLVITSTLSS